jgi:hypothetical protein
MVCVWWEDKSGLLSKLFNILNLVGYLSWNYLMMSMHVLVRSWI